MKKILSTLLAISMVISISGCSAQAKTEKTPVETPIEEPVNEDELIETPVETPIETPVEEPIETPVDEPVEIQDTYAVSPGPTSDEDIEVGKGLVIEIFKLMYDHGDADEIDSESVERLKTLYDTPESIDVIIESGEHTLNYFETINVVKVTPSFIQHYVSTTGNQAIEYDTVVEFMFNGEAEPKIFKTTIAKRDNNLKLAGFE